MATSMDLAELVECPIHLGPYDDPRMLICGHTICLICIREHIDRTQLGGIFFCPECRRECQVPQGGAVALPRNIRLYNISQFLAAQRPPSRDSSPSVSLGFPLAPPSGTVGKDDDVDMHEKCKIHPLQDVSQYCEECHITCCPECLLKSHRKHDTCSLNEYKSKQELVDLITKVNTDIDRMQARIDNSQQEYQKCRRDLTEVRQRVVQTTDHLVTVLHQQRDEVLKGLTGIEHKVDGRMQEVDAQLKSRCAALEKIRSKGEQFLAMGQPDNIHERTENLKQQLTETDLSCTLLRWSSSIKMKENPAFREQMIGTINVKDKEPKPKPPKTSSKPQTIRRFPLYNKQDGVTGIAMVYEYICVAHHSQGDIYLYVRDGACVRRVKVEGLSNPRCIATVDKATGRLVISDWKARQLHWVELSPSLEIVCHQRTGVHYQPCGITSSSSTGNVVVTGRTPNEVHVYNSQGTELEYIQLRRDVPYPWSSLLVSGPRRSDTFLVSYFYQAKYHLAWVDRQSRVMHKISAIHISGLPPGETSLDGILDVVETQGGRLVAIVKDSILLLEETGAFVQCLMQERDKNRQCQRLCLDQESDTLYVVCASQEVVCIPVEHIFPKKDKDGAEAEEYIDFSFEANITLMNASATT